MIYTNDFKLCPMCGSHSIKNVNNRKWLCSDCGFDLYNNVAAAVGVVLADHSGNVLLEQRAKDPRKGFLAFPGGFVDPDESAEHAAMRECREEIGVEPVTISYLCSFPNTYEYKHIIYKTCDIFFEACLPESIDSVSSFIEGLRRQESEVLGFVSVHVETADDIARIPLAFESARETLKCYINRMKKEK